MTRLQSIRAWFTTPRTLQVALVLTALAAAFFFWTQRAGYQQNQHAAELIGRSTTTGIIAAQTLKVELAGMHAVAGEQILSKNGSNPQLQEEFADKRKRVSESLVTASKSITFGAAESVPLQRIQYLLPTYGSLISEALTAKAKGDTTTAAQRYLKANELMEQYLLPSASSLDEANSAAMNLNYSQQLSASSSNRSTLLVSGAILLVLLVVAQIYMMRRFRRMLNPAMALATVLAIGSAGWFYMGFSAVNSNLSEAKEEAFDKLHSVYRTEAQAYVARFAVQNQLIARMAGQEATDPTGKFNPLVANLPRGYSFSTFANDVASGKVPDEPTGFVPRLARRTMFSGEEKALAEALTALGAYSQMQQKVSSALAAGRTDEASATVLNDKSFDQLVTALNKAKEINRAEFDADTQSAFAALSGKDWAAPIGALFIVLLAMFGLRQRWNEYNV